MKGLRPEPESHQEFVSGDRASREFASPSLQVPEHSVTCPCVRDVLREFNRDTFRLAIGLLGILLLAALLFLVLFPEPHTMPSVSSERESQAKSGSSPVENAAALFRNVVPESRWRRTNLSLTVVTSLNLRR